MTLDADRLLATPDHHFLSFDGGSALFLPMDRESYHRSAFLDRRAEALSSAPIRLPVEPLIAAARANSPPQLGWIFHVAHCGSTLLSRLIDSVPSNLVLREPPPLRQLGLAAAAGDRSESWKDRLPLANAMAARRFDGGRLTVVKANVPVNFMLDALHEIDPQAPAILLHFALEPYLVAILRSPQHRTWVERITEALWPALNSEVGLTRNSAMAEKAAALWLAQMLAFARLQSVNPASRSLDARQLFDDPVATGAAAATHFDIHDAEVAANAAALTGHYAKDMSKPFDDNARRQREIDDRVRLEAELAVARRWIEQCKAAERLPARLDRPLIGEAPVLLD